MAQWKWLSVDLSFTVKEDSRFDGLAGVVNWDSWVGCASGSTSGTCFSREANDRGCSYKLSVLKLECRYWGYSYPDLQPDRIYSGTFRVQSVKPKSFVWVLTHKFSTKTSAIAISRVEERFEFESQLSLSVLAAIQRESQCVVVQRSDPILKLKPKLQTKPRTQPQNPMATTLRTGPFLAQSPHLVDLVQVEAPKTRKARKFESEASNVGMFESENSDLILLRVGETSFPASTA
ncbi:hypothetical protein CPB83DRAFT_832359 [Crepidotus variabilis]|uniref:Uncharacterized protein n=1 Tax=Crepidotus variabilis TaxID=179855 RepID=A0A9P6ER06_9AGAR|nr:hypothetical protein CPB83DRAFT_832359 [Crepidotus variabilis]